MDFLKRGNHRKGVVDLEKGVMTPITNYDMKNKNKIPKKYMET